MNAAAKAINQSNFFTGHLSDMHFSKLWCLVLILLMVVLASSLAVVYSTNEYRVHFNQLQQLEQQKHHLQLQWGQLLLEQASLATPARVEALAVQKLNMHAPDDKQMFVLQVK